MIEDSPLYVNDVLGITKGGYCSLDILQAEVLLLMEEAFRELSAK